MTLDRRTGVWLLALVMVVAARPHLASAECITVQMSLAEWVDSSRFVFFADVVSVENVLKPESYRIRVRFRIIEAFKGTKRGNVTLDFRPIADEFQYQRSQSVLVFAVGTPGDSSSACNATRIATADDTDLRQLRALKYVRAKLDDKGALSIVTPGSGTIKPVKEREQVSFANPQITPGGDAVGWLAAFPNCCTSYPIPLKLMILTNGRTRSFTGSGLPIWQWMFQDGGKQVAFRQETVHGGLGVHYELRDLASGRLVASYDPPVGPDNVPAVPQNVPEWVTELDSASKKQ